MASARDMTAGALLKGVFGLQDPRERLAEQQLQQQQRQQEGARDIGMLMQRASSAKQQGNLDEAMGLLDRASAIAVESGFQNPADAMRAAQQFIGQQGFAQDVGSLSRPTTAFGPAPQPQVLEGGTQNLSPSFSVQEQAPPQFGGPEFMSRLIQSGAQRGVDPNFLGKLPGLIQTPSAVEQNLAQAGQAQSAGALSRERMRLVDPQIAKEQALTRQADATTGVRQAEVPLREAQTFEARRRGEVVRPRAPTGPELFQDPATREVERERLRELGTSTVTSRSESPQSELLGRSFQTEQVTAAELYNSFSGTPEERTRKVNQALASRGLVMDVPTDEQLGLNLGIGRIGTGINPGAISLRRTGEPRVSTKETDSVRGGPGTTSGGIPTQPLQGQQQTTQERPRVINPNTGQVLEFDGKQWVPVR